jgi:hypothetical protein
MRKSLNALEAKNSRTSSIGIHLKPCGYNPEHSGTEPAPLAAEVEARPLLCTLLCPLCAAAVCLCCALGPAAGRRGHTAAACPLCTPALQAVLLYDRAAQEPAAMLPRLLVLVTGACSDSH